MLNNGCVPSESGPTEVTADFRFTRVMAEQAARARLTLDDDQLSPSPALTPSVSSWCPRQAGRRGVRLGTYRAREKLYPRPLFRQPAARRRGGSIFITSSANCTSG